MHTIRLRGFWETTSDGVHATHSRAFGRPRTLDAGERVWLICTSVPGPAEVLVNGHMVGAVAAAGPFAADVTNRLQPRNTVRFAIASGELIGEVSLEIRREPN